MLDLLVDNQKLVDNKRGISFTKKWCIFSKVGSIGSIFALDSKSHSLNVICYYGGKYDQMNNACPLKINQKGPKTKKVVKTIFRAICLFSRKSSTSKGYCYLHNWYSRHMIGSTFTLHHGRRSMVVMWHLDTMEW